MLLGLSLICLAAGLASASHYRQPQTLHERTCYGLWLNSVHLHGYCVVDVETRAKCAEMTRLFETLDSRFDPVPYSKVPRLVMLRALQEHALLSNPDRVLCINRDTTFREPNTGCFAGFHYNNGSCYTATKRHVSYEEARQECGSIHGKLVGGTEEIADNDPRVEILLDLVKFYIKDDVFTSYIQIAENEHYVRDPLKDAYIEVDYETDQLQYVHASQKRGFICEVKPNVPTQLLFQPVDFPVATDDLVVYDKNPLPPTSPNVERYLVDLLRFRCPGNFSDKGVPDHDVIRHRSDLDDLDAHYPYGCHYETTVGNVVADLTNPRHKPKELNRICHSLVPLYRYFDHVLRLEYFGVHLPHKKSFGGFVEEADSNDPIGFCARRQGDCGASVPLFNPNSSRPVCYLFKSQRNLNYELREGRPLRYAQIADRLVNIYSSKHLGPVDYTIQTDPSPQSNSTEPKLLGSVISPLRHHELDSYCKRHLVPLYKIRNLKHRNEFMVVQEYEVRQYRKDRDNYNEEELLGYCSSKPGYCGAGLPLYNYIYRYSDSRRDDAYYNVEQPVGSDVNHEILCYIF